MGKFREYARDLNKKATEAFELYQKAEKEFKRAEQIRKDYPLSVSYVSAAYAAKSARAQADYLEARENLKTAQDALRARTNDFNNMRGNLSDALKVEYSADPARIDANTMELLKAGILNPAEYERLLFTAQENNNFTMARIIGKYAATAAEQAAREKGENCTEAIKLRAIAYQSRTSAEGEYLKAFDYLIDVYNRCANNPPMIEKWEELTAELMDTE